MEIVVVGRSSEKEATVMYHKKLRCIKDPPFFRTVPNKWHCFDLKSMENDISKNPLRNFPVHKPQSLLSTVFTGTISTAENCYSEIGAQWIIPNNVSKETSVVKERRHFRKKETHPS